MKTLATAFALIATPVMAQDRPAILPFDRFKNEKGHFTVALALVDQ